MNYKEDQRQARRAGKTGRVIWISVSCDLFGRHKIQGTKRTRTGSHRIRGKAAVKAAKRATHNRGHYREQRLLIARVF